MKKEVLEFFLSSELRERESFFFTLFQVKEYYNVEELLGKLTFFNVKLMKEAKAKLKELEKNKVSWITKERFNENHLKSKLRLD